MGQPGHELTHRGNHHNKGLSLGPLPKQHHQHDLRGPETGPQSSAQGQTAESRRLRACRTGHGRDRSTRRPASFTVLEVKRGSAQTCRVGDEMTSAERLE